MYLLTFDIGVSHSTKVKELYLSITYPLIFRIIESDNK